MEKYIFKLITGETVVASAVEVQTGWELHKPLVLVPVSTAGSKIDLRFTSFIIGCTEEPITIQEYHIVSVAKPQPQIISDYVRVTTGITLATSMPK